MPRTSTPPALPSLRRAGLVSRGLLAGLVAVVLALGGVATAHSAGPASTAPSPGAGDVSSTVVTALPAVSGEPLPEGESDGVGVDESDSHPEDGEGDSGVIVVAIVLAVLLAAAIAAAFFFRGRERRKVDRR